MDNSIKRIISVGVAICIATCLSAQRPKLYIPVDKVKGTTEWWDSYCSLRTEKTGLPCVYNSADSLCFSFTTHTQTIMVWTNNFTTFNGAIASYIYQGSVSGKLFKQTTSLDTITAKNVYKLFADSNVFAIPDKDYWSNWQDYFCMGSYYTIELSTPKGYTYKRYTIPEQQVGIKEATTIAYIAKQVNTVGKMEKAWDEFMDGLPDGAYTYNNTLIISKGSIKRKKK